LFVQNKGEVASNCVFVDQTQRTFLDDGSRANAVSNHLQDKEAALTIKLGELETLSVPQIAWLVTVVALLFMLGNQSVQVDVRGKVRLIFAEVVVSVDFKHLYLHLLNVFNVHMQPDCLLDREGFLVVVSELDISGVLKLIDDLFGLCIILNFEVVQIINLCFESVQVVLSQLLRKLFGNFNTLFNLKIFEVGLYEFLDQCLITN
jgi:hypothetical protein